MENTPMTDTVPTRDVARVCWAHDTRACSDDRSCASRARHRSLRSCSMPVGTNLADVERWMIFATLQKCGGNKTRAAALLGVSLKTLYNRLNAYRAQGLVMDYAADCRTGHRDHRPAWRPDA